MIPLCKLCKTSKNRQLSLIRNTRKLLARSNTGKNTKFPHAYFVCKIENPHLLSFHAWLLYGKLLDKILQFSLPYKKQPWKFHFPILTWKITFPQIIFYFPRMYFCSLKKLPISTFVFCM